MSSTGTELSERRVTKTGKLDKRGIKYCPKCRNKSGVRTLICKKCQYEFESGKSIKNRIESWRELNSGDKIKVSGGSFYLTQDEDGNPVRLPFGYRGLGTVKEVQENGILIFNDNNETEYVYMGKKYHNESLNIHKRPAKLSRYKPKRRKKDAS